jgi:hypothetical protein
VHLCGELNRTTEDGVTRRTAAFAAAGVLIAFTGTARAEDAPRPPRVLLLAEPNQPELAAEARGLLDELSRDVVEPGVSTVSPRLFKDCVFLIGPEPDKADACAGPVIARQNRDLFARTVVVLVAGRPHGAQRWTCLASTSRVSFGLDLSDRKAAAAWAEACVATAHRLAPATR